MTFISLLEIISVLTHPPEINFDMRVVLVFCNGTICLGTGNVKIPLIILEVEFCCMIHLSESVLKFRVKVSALDNENSSAICALVIHQI